MEEKILVKFYERSKDQLFEDIINRSSDDPQ